MTDNKNILIYSDQDEMGETISAVDNGEFITIFYGAICFTEEHRRDIKKSELIKRCNDLMKEFGGVY